MIEAWQVVGNLLSAKAVHILYVSQCIRIYGYNAKSKNNGTGSFGMCEATERVKTTDSMKFTISEHVEYP